MSMIGLWEDAHNPTSGPLRLRLNQDNLKAMHGSPRLD
jgi:hypothetical protein